MHAMHTMHAMHIFDRDGDGKKKKTLQLSSDLSLLSDNNPVAVLSPQWLDPIHVDFFSEGEVNFHSLRFELGLCLVIFCSQRFDRPAVHGQRFERPGNIHVSIHGQRFERPGM